MNYIKENVSRYRKYYLSLVSIFFKYRRFIILLLFIISYIASYFLVDNSSQSLVAHDEGLYARRSRLIEQSNNWFDSPFDEPHHKTLGSYWLIALALRFIGSSELALRIPTIICSFLCIIIVFYICLEISNQTTGIISIISLISMPLWIQYSRYASPDIPFVLCVLIVILSFLKSINSSAISTKYISIFICGFFITFSFFIRSYMSFVPLISLTPFFIYRLAKEDYKLRFFLSCGIIIGFIPSLFNLYYAYQSYGFLGINSLFEFARKQAIGISNINNVILLPLNFIYLTFPIGFIFIFFLLFTKSKTYIRYPLLVYCYPFLSLLIITSMSKSYSHYYLFLLPSLSIIFALKIQNFTYRFIYAQKLFKYFLLTFLILIPIVFILSITLYSEYLPTLLYGNIVIYFAFLLFSISFIYLFFNILIKKRLYSNNIKVLVYFISVSQITLLSLLYNLGFIGNPNLKTKLFLSNTNVNRIVKSNTIYLINVSSKIETLLSYYLPSSTIVDFSKKSLGYSYIITSDKKVVEASVDKSIFKIIKNFDDNYLLMNISK